MRREEGTLRVMYTNLDGILSSVLEVRNYLRENRPEESCKTETKLIERIHLGFMEEGFKNWRRDRKIKGRRGRVLIMFQDDIYVEDVQYGHGMAEVIGITIRTNGREKRRIILTYVPPRTNTWRLEEHKEMQRELLSA